MNGAAVRADMARTVIVRRHAQRYRMSAFGTKFHKGVGNREGIVANKKRQMRAAMTACALPKKLEQVYHCKK